MELLPVIYNTLLIAAALFVITVAISYISYKIKQSKGLVEDSNQPASLKSVFHDKKKVEEELKPHYRTKYPKPPPQPRKEQKKVAKKEVPKVRKKETSKEKPEPVHKKVNKQKPAEKSNNRIERVTELVPSSKPTEDKEKKPVEKHKVEIEEQKSKKNLKSIDDDPLKRYTDSAEDELHPLKTNK